MKETHTPPRELQDGRICHGMDTPELGAADRSGFDVTTKDLVTAGMIDAYRRKNADEARGA